MRADGVGDGGMGKWGGKAWTMAGWDEGEERQWRDGATFRLFAGRGDALTACGAANFAAAPCEFARKLAARPHGSAGGWAGEGALVRLLFLSRAGWGYAGRCPDPLRKLSFLRTFHLLPRLRTKRSSTPKRRRSPATIAGLRRQFVLTFSQKRTAAVEPRPPRRRLRQP